MHLELNRRQHQSAARAPTGDSMMRIIYAGITFFAVTGFALGLLLLLQRTIG
jgi:hypothetical protein